MKEGGFFYARWPLVTQFKNVPREGEAKSRGCGGLTGRRILETRGKLTKLIICARKRQSGVGEEGWGREERSGCFNSPCMGAGP